VNRQMLNRRELLLCLGAATALPSYGGISQKTIDRRNASEVGEYAIGFASKIVKGDDYEHAFVVWYYSDAAGMRTVRRAAGFYPAGDVEWYNLMLGAEGSIADDARTKINEELTVLVNGDIFNQAMSVEGRYKSGHTYRLGVDDCTTFVAEVASCIP